MAAPSADETDHGRLLTLAVLALVVGAAAGLIGAVFRIVLEQADRWRDRFISWAHGEAVLGFVLVVAAGAAAALVAAWLVRRFSPHASGSGIPHVEAVLRREVPPAPYMLLPVKFVGGVLAIGSGMALGREGPSVQMGASIAHFVGTVCRCSWPDCRVLMAAGAGAGLATAFNSPIAGAVFVLEELVQRFEHRIAIAALAPGKGVREPAEKVVVRLVAQEHLGAVGLPCARVCGAGDHQAVVLFVERVERHLHLARELLLDADVVFTSDKTLRHHDTGLHGYEIHHGQLARSAEDDWFGVGIRRETVYGTHWHGLLDNNHFRRRWLMEAAANKPGFVVADEIDVAARRDGQLDLMADLLTAHLHVDAVLALLDDGPPDRPTIVTST